VGNDVGNGLEVTGCFGRAGMTTAGEVELIGLRVLTRLCVSLKATVDVVDEEGGREL